MDDHFTKPDPSALVHEDRASWEALNALENLSGAIHFDVISADTISAVCEKAAKSLRRLLETPPEVLTMAATINHLKQRLDYRMNDYLCEMKEGYDDSITGFNEAWDLMRELFKDAASNLATASKEQTEA